MMYGYYGNHMGAGAWLAMALSFVLFWGLLAVLAVVVVRALRGGQGGLGGQGQTGAHLGSGPAGHGGPSPADVLAQRFARGEIDEAEYADRLRVLREQGY